MTKVETVVGHSCLLGEGPVWDHKVQRLLWLDITEGHIHQYFPADNSFKTCNIGEMVGAIALSGTRFVAALESGFAFVDLHNGTTEPIADPEIHIINNRFNDGKCDAAGRFWAGTMSLTEDHGAGSLYVLHHDLSVEKKIENVSISNGLAWSLDEKTFYYIDSPTRQVVSYRYHKESGNISDRKIVISMSESDGFPDGMTIDTEGMLWIAHWGAWKVARWNPDTGEKLYQIDLPVSQVSSCTFGGEDFQDIYITSASIGLTEEQKQKEPLAGFLFVVKKCGYTGMGAIEFKSAINTLSSS